MYTSAAGGAAEKTDLKFGYIKTTDMAPLAIARYLGYFEAEGLNVTLLPEADWQVLIEDLASGKIDGAMVLAPQALEATLGLHENAEIVVPVALGRNGSAITVSNDIWKTMKLLLPEDENGRPLHPIDATTLLPIKKKLERQGSVLHFGEPFSYSMQNYLLRYWLAEGQTHPGFYDPTHPDGDILGTVELMEFPPSAMSNALKARLLEGFVSSEPWNHQALHEKAGVPVITTQDIWPYHPEKVFAFRKDFAESYPETVFHVTKALIRAGRWLDENDGSNRPEAIEVLRRPEYVGVSPRVMAGSLLGTFEYEKRDERPSPDFNVFYRDFATFPYYSDAIWMLTQMRRWGQIAEAKPDGWYLEIAKRVYRPDIYFRAAEELVKEHGISRDEFPWESDGYRRQSETFFDGTTFDASQPNAYIDSFAIGLKGAQRIESEQVVQ